jgi:hypothetical protein
MKKLPLFLYIVTYGVLVFTLIIFIEERDNINWYAYAAALIAMVVFSIIATYAISSYFISIISSNGINGFNFVGKRKFIEWSEVVLVKPSNLGGLRYLRVFSRKSMLALWLPMNVGNINGLLEDVIALVPENNPLSEYLLKNG